MLFPGTPSPFRLSRRQHSTRRGAGPRFSNSPRFLLSQSTPKHDNDLEIDDEDGNDAPSTSRTPRTPAASHSTIPPPRRQREVIEDFDEDEPLTEDGVDTNDQNEDGVVDDGINSTPPGESGTPGPFDEEFDAIFAPERDGQKRRRLELGGRISLDRKSDQKSPLPTLSSEPRQKPITALDSPTSRSTPGAFPPKRDVHETPAPRVRTMGPGFATPGTISTPFRSKPRFMVSTKKPPNTQSHTRGETPSISRLASPPERRKPNFILPRSPSPSAVAEDIPAPFSPSSRALRGMAAEVRSWILEMGSKREAVSNLTLQPDQTPGTRQYLATVRVIHANHAVLSSAGPLTFVQAEKTNGTSTDINDPEIIQIMMMGLPRSRQVPRADIVQFAPLQTGDLLGIHHGLTWNVELHAFQSLDPCLASTESLPIPSAIKNAGYSPKKDWLIAMEWDILEI
ncbi:hypothetical protein N7450_009577 [Penicillium hetheringtonii]|uniref:Uncharacterized protein n=1 Tax=Penicillium hetheringtonii TaxID=911720 RepID=A0AAD6DB72_9EURO|nr:hypothetical protein N7450_009577 [Penicillium hetheringtonii]